MKKLPILIFLLTSSIYAIGQISNDTLQAKTVEEIVETPPEPNGGMTEFMKFVSSNLKYPKDARKQKIQGKVFVEFVVSNDGTVKQESVRVLKGLCESIDKEALRVIKLCPKWIPAAQKGQPVNARSHRALALNCTLSGSLESNFYLTTCKSLSVDILFC
jgi:periplasmic protein TonB